MIGRAHLRDGLPCQDMATVRPVGRNAVIAVVADGAGSAALSDEGAAIAVATVIAFLHRKRRARSGKEMGTRLLDAIVAALHALAANRGRPLRDFASTLLALIAQRDEAGVRWTAFHLGDGVIAADLGDGVHVLSGPDNGKYGNSTYFTTGADAGSRLRVLEGRHRNVAFALMSDGAAEVLHQRRENRVAPAVDTLFDWARGVGPIQFARALADNLERVVATRTTDDTALAIITFDRD